MTPEELGTFIIVNYGRLKRLAERILRARAVPGSDSEDFIQQLVIKLLLSIALERIDPQTPGGFLNRSLVNAIIDAIRKWQRRPPEVSISAMVRSCGGSDTAEPIQGFDPEDEGDRPEDGVDLLSPEEMQEKLKVAIFAGVGILAVDERRALKASLTAAGVRCEAVALLHPKLPSARESVKQRHYDQPLRRAKERLPAVLAPFDEFARRVGDHFAKEYLEEALADVRLSLDADWRGSNEGNQL